MFTGYCDNTIDFLWGIRFNNERSWFEAHKGEYLQYVLQPTRELGEEVYGYMADKYPDLWLNLHVSRIYRDARRLFGRGPYKDHLWFSLRHENDQWPCRPEFYFEISPDGYSYGMGFWSATPQVMERFRREAAEDPAPLEKLARQLSRRKEFTLQGECYKRPKAAPSPLLAPWFARKYLVLGHEASYDEAAFSHTIADTLKGGFDFLVPFYRRFAAACQAESPSQPEWSP